MYPEFNDELVNASKELRAKINNLMNDFEKEHKTEIYMFMDANSNPPQRSIGVWVEKNGTSIVMTV